MRRVGWMSGTRVDASETEAIWGITMLPTHAGCPPLGYVSLTESTGRLPAHVSLAFMLKEATPVGATFTCRI